MLSNSASKLLLMSQTQNYRNSSFRYCAEGALYLVCSMEGVLYLVCSTEGVLYLVYSTEGVLCLVCSTEGVLYVL